MTLTEIASFVNLGTNNQMSVEQIVLIMDSVQKNVFQKNQQAFLVYDQELTILTELEFAQTGYTSPVSSDIGKTVVGATSGTTGVLVSYSGLKWQLSGVDGEFTTGEAITITTGTGEGDLEEQNFQHGWKGPYDAPTDPACRKIWGVTRREPSKFWLEYVSRCGYWYSINGVWQTEDYRAFWGDRLYPFMTGNTYDLSNQFLFSFDPVPQAAEDHPYYWVYWKNPPTITMLDETGTLLVPDAYHLNFANACQQAAKGFLEGSPISLDDIVKANLGGWVNSLLAPFRSEWRGSNMTQSPGAAWS